MYKILCMALAMSILSFVKSVKSATLIIVIGLLTLQAVQAKEGETIAVAADTFEAVIEDSRVASSSSLSVKAAAQLTTGCKPIQTGTGPAFSVQTMTVKGSASGKSAAKAKKRLYPLYIKAAWLPTKPANPDRYLKGVDTDKDCVRDDVELFIGKLLPKASDYQARTYLLNYARWLGLAFKYEPNHTNLAFNSIRLNENTNRVIVREQSRNAVCFRRVHGQGRDSQLMLHKVFAEVHSTRVRSKVYRLGARQLAGWDPKRDQRGQVGFSCT